MCTGGASPLARFRIRAYLRTTRHSAAEHGGSLRRRHGLLGLHVQCFEQSPDTSQRGPLPGTCRKRDACGKPVAFETCRGCWGSVPRVGTGLVGRTVPPSCPAGR